jgi:isohexenylglutaconyl-CoA hydratase
MRDLPSVSTLLLAREGATLFVTINRPDVKNALTDEVIRDLASVCGWLEAEPTMRAVVLRGSDGMFCSGGDIRGFKKNFEAAAPTPGEKDSIARGNRTFGDFLIRFNSLPQTTIGVIEGAAFGGGLGLVCVTDIAICLADTRFALSETSLGVIPAQIAPFVVQRVGLTQARHLALSGARFAGEEALELGLVHLLARSPDELETTLAKVLKDIGRCGPSANAATKKVMLASLTEPLPKVLDDAADAFAKALRGPEGQEGVKAFLEKRPASWVEQK